MFEPLNFGNFLQANFKAIGSGNYSVLTEMWGVTEKIAVKTDLYFLPVNTFKTIYGSYTVPTLEKLIAQGYGMFKNQTVNDWYAYHLSTLQLIYIDSLFSGSS